MVFSSTIFVFFYLPVTLIGLFLCPKKWKNGWLLIMSLLFYFWGGSVFFPIIVFSILLNYTGGRLIDWFRQKGKESWSKICFISAIIMNLGNLIYWKYAKFLLETVQDITGVRFSMPDIILPIGISFFTFQGMSYVIDLYRKKVPVQKSIFRLALYISLFPQLIAGPIVRYADIEEQLTNRKCTADKFVSGIKFFSVGLAKKAILANSLALTADKIFALSAEQRTISVAWCGLLFYTFQLYFDFSGYSDMAIGLGKMFGFEFPENFNYPFISCSITEFWRRWHISLSSWFRDYVYIPLGGNRTGNVYLNLFIVFLLTGIWHGASWNFVLWGIYFGVIIVLEKLISSKCGKNKILSSGIGWVKTMFLWVMSMVLFRADTLADSMAYYRNLFGMEKLKNVGFTLPFYLHSYEIFIFGTCLIAMLPVGRIIYWKLQSSVDEKYFSVFSNIGTLVLLGTSVLYVATSTYNPFIYFQF